MIRFLQNNQQYFFIILIFFLNLLFLKDFNTHYAKILVLFISIILILNYKIFLINLDSFWYFSIFFLLIIFFTTFINSEIFNYQKNIFQFIFVFLCMKYFKESIKNCHIKLFFYLFNIFFLLFVFYYFFNFYHSSASFFAKNVHEEKIFTILSTVNAFMHASLLLFLCLFFLFKKNNYEKLILFINFLIFLLLSYLIKSYLPFLSIIIIFAYMIFFKIKFFSKLYFLNYILILFIFIGPLLVYKNLKVETISHLYNQFLFHYSLNKKLPIDRESIFWNKNYDFVYNDIINIKYLDSLNFYLKSNIDFYDFIGTYNTSKGRQKFLNVNNLLSICQKNLTIHRSKAFCNDLEKFLDQQPEELMGEYYELGPLFPKWKIKLNDFIKYSTQHIKTDNQHLLSIQEKQDFFYQVGIINSQYPVPAFQFGTTEIFNSNFNENPMIKIKLLDPPLISIYYSLKSRIALYHQHVDIFLDRPWYGYGNFVVSRDWPINNKFKWEVTNSKPHNSIIMFGQLHGIIFLLVLFFFFCSIQFKLNSIFDNKIKLYLNCLFVSLLILINLEDYFAGGVFASFFIYWFVLGYLNQRSKQNI